MFCESRQLMPAQWGICCLWAHVLLSESSIQLGFIPAQKVKGRRRQKRFASFWKESALKGKNLLPKWANSTLLHEKASTLKGKNLLPQGRQVFPFRVDIFLGGAGWAVKQTKSHKSCLHWWLCRYILLFECSVSPSLQKRACVRHVK